jgi:hypothetical protein
MVPAAKLSAAKSNTSLPLIANTSPNPTPTEFNLTNQPNSINPPNSTHPNPKVLRDTNLNEDDDDDDEGEDAAPQRQPGGGPPLKSISRDEHESAISQSYAQLAELEASGLDAKEANSSAGAFSARVCFVCVVSS